MSNDDESDYQKAYETEKKKNSMLEILFEEKTHDLYQANQQLKLQQKTIIKSEKLASAGRLAAGIAHEINNPLTFVLSNLAILKDELKESLYKEHLELLEDALEGAERIKTIVKNVNNYSRTKASELSPFNINQAILSSLHLIKNRIVNKISLQIDLAELPVINGNLNELKQAVLNLFINAIVAIDAADKPREERELSIQTSIDETFGHILLTVSDTGTGIKESEQLNIFDPFFTTKAPGEGSGLGLYVCHEIIKAHGGSIEVKSIIGEGTSFKICIPVKLHQANQAP